MKQLEKLGVLMSIIHNEAGFDRTKSYAINYERLYELTGIEYHEAQETADGK